MHANFSQQRLLGESASFLARGLNLLHFTEPVAKVFTAEPIGNRARQSAGHVRRQYARRGAHFALPMVNELPVVPNVPKSQSEAAGEIAA